jgi:hypothetical protein
LTRKESGINWTCYITRHLWFIASRHLCFEKPWDNEVDRHEHHQISEEFSEENFHHKNPTFDGLSAEIKALEVGYLQKGILGQKPDFLRIFKSDILGRTLSSFSRPDISSFWPTFSSFSAGYSRHSRPDFLILDQTFSAGYSRRLPDISRPDFSSFSAGLLVIFSRIFSSFSAGYSRHSRPDILVVLGRTFSSFSAGHCCHAHVPSKPTWTSRRTFRRKRTSRGRTQTTCPHKPRVIIFTCLRIISASRVVTSSYLGHHTLVITPCQNHHLISVGKHSQLNQALLLELCPNHVGPTLLETFWAMEALMFD